MGSIGGSPSPPLRPSAASSRLEGEPVLLYSLLSPPGEAAPGLLSDLYRIKNTLTVTIEWRPAAQDSSRRKIQSARRYYFSKRYTWFAHLQQKESTDAALSDDAADTEAERLGDALVELQSDGVAYGDIALTLSLHGDLADTERLDGEIRRIFNAHDAKIIRESYGQLPVWFARLPGQTRSQQIRTVFGSSGLAACLAPIFGPPAAEDHSKHLDQPPLATFETRWNTPCHYDLFDGDVGHTLVLGSTGSGKSFLLNFLLVSSLQYDPRILILDLGGSYRWLTRFLGGNYLELSPQAQSLQLNPFSLPDTERSYQFLTGWVSRLLRLGGYHTTGDDPTEIRDRIKDLYALAAERRTLDALLKPSPLQCGPLWPDGTAPGVWAPFFGSSNTRPDLPTHKNWQVIDLAGAAEHEDLCEAALFYLLERLRLDIESPHHRDRLKIMVVDEAWRFLKDPAALGYLAEAAKTWRKHNAALILATQSAADITATPGAEVLLESLPTKLLLSNPNLPDSTAASLRLHPAELDKIRGLVPKKELYFRRPDFAGILQLNVDPISYWLYTSSAIQAAQREKAVNQYGLERALQVLSQGSAIMTTSKIPKDIIALHIAALCAFPLLLAFTNTANSQSDADTPPAANTSVLRIVETQDQIITVRTKVRHTTVLVLPRTETILDFVVGDSDYWALTGSANVAYIKPLAQDLDTNVTLVCSSGRIYAFLVTEASPPHLVVRIERPKKKQSHQLPQPAFVARSQVEGYQLAAQQAAHQATAASQDARQKDRNR